MFVFSKVFCVVGSLYIIERYDFSNIYFNIKGKICGVGMNKYMNDINIFLKEIKIIHE